MRTSLLRVLVTGTLWCVASAAHAQFTEYTPPGGVQLSQAPTRDSLEKQVEDARWRLGILHVDPRYGIKDVAWVESPQDTGTGTDLTGTVGAGLRAFLRTGPKLFWVAEAAPEYVWWRHLSARRRLDDRFGASLYGFFNRLTLTVKGDRDEQQGIATPELLTPVSTRQDHGEIDAEVKVAGGFGAFASGSWTRFTSLVQHDDTAEAQSLDQLDRDEEVGRAGLRLHAHGGWTLGLGAEVSQVTFRSGAGNPNNRGTAPVLEVHLDRPLVRLDADVAARSLQPYGNGSDFVTYHKVTGNFQATFGSGNVNPAIYGSRNLVYSLLPGFPYLTDDHLGLALKVKLGWRTNLRAFGEIGHDHYAAASGLSSPDGPPSENLNGYGAELRYDIGRRASATFAASRQTYTGDPTLARSYTNFAATVTFGDL